MARKTKPNADAETRRSGLPLVSIVIVYYKRRETIAESIDSVLRQEYPHREVIVVDNHSQDGLKQWIETHGHDVTLIELPQNLGANGGRNAGIRAARGASSSASKTTLVFCLR